MSDEVAEKVVKIIADQALLDPSEVEMDATPDDLGLDSLGLVEVVFAIEEEFDLSVPYNANEPNASDFDISNVGSVIQAVKQLISEKA
jgi:acyl carrier protein